MLWKSCSFHSFINCSLINSLPSAIILQICLARLLGIHHIDQFCQHHLFRRIHYIVLTPDHTTACKSIAWFSFCIMVQWEYYGTLSVGSHLLNCNSSQHIPIFCITIFLLLTITIFCNVDYHNILYCWPLWYFVLVTIAIFCIVIFCIGIFCISIFCIVDHHNILYHNILYHNILYWWPPRPKWSPMMSCNCALTTWYSAPRVSISWQLSCWCWRDVVLRNIFTTLSDGQNWSL